VDHAGRPIRQATSAGAGARIPVRGLALAVAVVLVFWRLGDIILLLFAAILLAIMLTVPARWIARRTGVAYPWCLAGVVIVIALVLGGVVMGLARELVAQLNQVMTQLPNALHQVADSLRSTALGKLLLGQLAEQGGQLTALTGPLLQSLSSISFAIGALVFVVAIGLYGAASPEAYRRGLLQLVPARAAEPVRDSLDRITAALERFLLGRLLSMAVIGSCSIVGLWALGVPAPVALGLIAGGLSFVPYVGAAASCIPACLMAYVQQPIAAAYVLGLYLGIHVLDAYVLVPLVQRRMVHLPPAVILTAQVVLGSLWGVLGIALATPIAAAVAALIETTANASGRGD